MRGGCFRVCRTVLSAAGIAGAFFFLSAFAPPRMPDGCKIGGTDVSGMTVAAARARLSEELRADAETRELRIEAEGRSYIFRAPELYYRADVEEALRQARKGAGEYPLPRQLALTNLEDTLRGICDNCYRKSKNARMAFLPTSKQPFTFEAEEKGRYADGRLLREEVLAALGAGGGTVKVSVREEAAGVSEQSLRDSAVRLSRFSTRYADGCNRAHNIALAAEKINGTVLCGGEVFSFNATVGARTQERGFYSAPIIQDGEFKAGVGGGVCQVSTTVYNAALLSGMTIVEQHPHSLAVGYVEPSFDAMVSGTGCDLKFKNGTKGKVYVLARASGGVLTVEIYGEKTDITYERRSVVVETIAPPAPQVREGEAECVLRAEKQGLRSEGYLVRLKDGKEIGSVCLRRDRYAPVQGIIQKIPQDSGQEILPDVLHLIVKCDKI